MSIIENTMRGILDALPANARVTTQDVRKSVILNGGRVGMIGSAAKRLRDMGYPVTVDRARHLTTWSCYAADADQEAWTERIMRDSYSQALSGWRALAGAQQIAGVLISAVAVSAMEGAVIGYGRALGMTLNAVISEMQFTPNAIGISWP